MRNYMFEGFPNQVPHSVLMSMHQGNVRKCLEHLSFFFKEDL